MHMPETSGERQNFPKVEQIKPLDNNHSELEWNKEKLAKYIRLLEEALGNGIKVVGILEIGSFANGEGMEQSDIDTRVYVEAPDAYIWNIAGHKSSEAMFGDKKIASFISACGEKQMAHFSWADFNEPMWKKLKEELGLSIEFGLVDTRYASYELDNLDSAPSNEHSFLTQSNIVFDPQSFLSGKKQTLANVKFPTMEQFYKERFLNKLPFEIYRHTEITEKDLSDIQERHKIQWVKWAVRCVREAVATKTYIASGNPLHKKEDVLSFYQKYLPEKYDFVAMLYDWKTNPKVRNEMIQECIEDPQKMSQKFKALMPDLEATIEAVKNIDL